MGALFSRAVRCCYLARRRVLDRRFYLATHSSLADRAEHSVHFHHLPRRDPRHRAIPDPVAHVLGKRLRVAQRQKWLWRLA